jgi:hypothetical protein
MSNDSPAPATTLTKPVVIRRPIARGWDDPLWHVEQFDDYGDSWRAVFTGPDSEVRARQYTAAIEAGSGPSHHHHSSTVKLTKPVVIRSVLSGWNVEQRDDDGERWRALFMGFYSEERARQYAEWIETPSGPSGHPAAALGIIEHREIDFAVHDDAPSSSLADVDIVSDHWAYVLELDLDEKRLFDDVLSCCEDLYREALARSETPPFAATPDDIARIRSKFRCTDHNGPHPRDLGPNWRFRIFEIWELVLEEDMMMALDGMLLHYRAHYPLLSARSTFPRQQFTVDSSIEKVQKRKRWARPPTS